MAAENNRKLKVTVEGDKMIILSRVFDAPRHLVWETMSKPEYVRRWWCCMDGYTMPVCEMDFRVGGAWRYVMAGADGNEVGFNGVYQEIEPTHKIVNTEIFEPFPDSPSTCTMTLEERDGRTYYQTVVVHLTQIARDMHVASGMETGAAIALDRLEAVAQSLAPATRGRTELAVEV